MAALVEIFLNDKPVRANIVDVNQVEGWVEIEDLTAVAKAATEEVDDPNQASNEKIEDLSTPSIKLPTKKLYGNVKIMVLGD